MGENEINVQVELRAEDYDLLNEIIDMEAKKAMLVKALWNKHLSEMQEHYDEKTDA